MATKVGMLYAQLNIYMQCKTKFQPCTSVIGQSGFSIPFTIKLKTMYMLLKRCDVTILQLMTMIIVDESSLIDTVLL